MGPVRLIEYSICYAHTFASSAITCASDAHAHVAGVAGGDDGGDRGAGGAMLM